jgi:response regulator of citrate/malate metabolism
VKFHALAISVALAALCAACTTSRVAEQIGEAHQETVARMTADPAAAQRNLDSPSGMDPLTGEQVMEKYQKKQGQTGKKRQTPSIIQIGTGSQR